VLEVLAFILAAVAVIVVVQVLADKTGLPAAALLTVSGLIQAFSPGSERQAGSGRDPDFRDRAADLQRSAQLLPLAIRKNLRVVISLSIELVLATALVVGVGIDLFVPGVGPAAGHYPGRCCCPARPGGRAGGRRPRRPAVPAYHHHRG
jgi:monovalent cation/hydrogen antiporter